MWSTTSAIVHFPVNGRNRASAALTVATTSSRSCAAAAIRALISAAFSSATRVRRYSSIRRDSGASSEPSTAHDSFIIHILARNYRYQPRAVSHCGDRSKLTQNAQTTDVATELAHRFQIYASLATTRPSDQTLGLRNRPPDGKPVSRSLTARHTVACAAVMIQRLDSNHRFLDNSDRLLS